MLPYIIYHAVLLLTVNVFSQTAFPLEQLIPTPHDITCQGIACFTGTTYILHNALLPQPSVDYLIQNMQKWCGLEPSDSSNISFSIEAIPPQANREYHELMLKDNSMVIRAATADGAQRGLGRLFGIIEQLSVYPSAQGLALPAVTIKDYPDFPWRGMHFQYGNNWSPWRLTYLEKMTDLLSRLGFNYIMVELGGRVQCDAYPELTRQPAWPNDAIQHMIAFANARGLRVYPAVNGPGHMACAPRLYPLPGKRSSGQEVKELIMDLSQPDFYTKWLAYLDSVADAFHNPEYFSIGTDEFHEGSDVFEAVTGCSITDSYIEFLSRTTEHLKQRGTKTCAWHDMMVDASSFGPQWTVSGEREPANGRKNLLSRIPKDLTIMYWYYGQADAHPVFDALQKTPNELWCAVWRSVPGMYKLLRQCRAIGMTHVLPCIWGFHPYNLVIPACADATWHVDNPLRKDEAYFADCNDRFFWAPFSPDTPAQECLAPNDSIILADIMPPEFSLPWDVDAMLAKGKLMVTVDGTYELLHCSQLHKNAPRLSEGIWFYTPYYGPSTKTNKWGDEIAVVNGLITAATCGFSDDKNVPEGNLAIPPNGMVLSFRRIFEPYFHPANWLRDAIRPGKKLILYDIPQKNVPQKATSHDFPQNIQSFRANLMLPRQFLRNGTIAQLRVTLADGSQQSVRLKGISFLMPSSSLPDGWHTGIVHRVPKHPVLEVAFTSENSTIRNLTIIPEQNGAFAKLTLTRLALFNRTKP